MFDESFWVAVAFVLFFVLFGRQLWRFVTSKLDERSAAVRAELETAARLREEARDLLATSRRRERESAAEAEAILARARDEASRIAADAAVRLDAELARRTRLAEERIALMEANAVAGLRAAAVDAVVAATGRAVAAEIDADADAALIDRAAAELETRLAA